MAADLVGDPTDDANGGGITVLVVTDDSDCDEAVAAALENAAESIATTVATADGTFERLVSDDVDCVVCGRPALPDVRDAVRRRRPALPIVLAASDGSPTALPEGVTDRLTVPIPDGRASLAARRIYNYGRRYRAERDADDYRALFEQLPDAVVVHDAAGNYQAANRRAVELLGYGRSELLEMTVPDVEVGSHRTDVVSTLADCDPGETVTVSGRNRRADGTEFPARVTIRRVDDDRFLAAVRDVSKLRAREHDLERSLDLLRQTEALADAGGWELNLRADELRWTEGTRRIHGVDDEYEPTLEDAIEFYRPGDRDRIERAVESAIEDGDAFDETARIVTANGETRTVRTRGQPRREDGETVRLRGAIWDVTERERTAAELRQREAHLEQAQSVAKLGSWHLQVGTNEIEWSDEVYRIFGLEPTGDATMSFDRFLELVHPDDRGFVMRRWFAALEGDTYDIEHRIVVDGETRWVREKAEFTFDDDGQPVTAIGVVQDVTDRKEYERRLEDKNEQLDVLNRLIRHDLRNQMNVIDGYAADLAERIDDETAGRLAARIRAAVDELLSISEEIRRVNRTVTDDPSGRPVDVAAVVDDAVASVRTDHDDFECERSIGDVWVRGTEALRIAVENVLENAIEHNDADEPRIEITATTCAETDTVRIRIADNGPGIPASERELITGDRQRTQLQHTSGVGLWVVNWIVSSFDGDLTFDDGDDGTVVSIELPRVEPEAGDL